MKRIALIEDAPHRPGGAGPAAGERGLPGPGVTDFAAVPGRSRPSRGRTWCCWTWASPARTASPCAPPCGGEPGAHHHRHQRDSALDELKALSLGGDDYITKPYNIPILLARIKAVLRRTGGGAGGHPHRRAPHPPPHPGHRRPGGPDGGADPERAERSWPACWPTRADRAPGRPHRGPVGQRDLHRRQHPQRQRHPAAGQAGPAGPGEAIKTRRGMGYQYDGTGLSR